MAMLFITHDLGIVRRIADRVCVMLKGKIVEQGPVAEIFDNPQHDYTKRLLAAEPKGRPAADRNRRGDPARSRADEDLVPDQDRLPAPHHRPCEGGGRHRDQGPRGRDARRRRRIGLRQDDARPRHPAADLVGRADRLPRQTGSTGSAAPPCGRSARISRSSSRTPMARCRRACRSPRSSAEGLTVQQSGLSYAAAPRDRRPRARRCRPRPRRHGPLPARILRRPAPAHRDRPRHGARSEIRRAGRADLGARHVGAGADRRAAARSPGQAQARLSLHQPRPQGRARALATGSW